MKDERSYQSIMIFYHNNLQQYFFWFLVILSSVQSQKDPVYDVDLSDSLHLKWQVDYDNGDVIFEVAFLDKKQGNFQGILYFL